METYLRPPLVGSRAYSLGMHLLVGLEMRANIWHLGAIRETRGDWVSGNGVDGHDRYDLGDGRWVKVGLRVFACKGEGCSARTGEPVRTD